MIGWLGSWFKVVYLYICFLGKTQAFGNGSWYEATDPNEAVSELSHHARKATPRHEDISKIRDVPTIEVCTKNSRTGYNVIASNQP